MPITHMCAHTYTHTDSRDRPLLSPKKGEQGGYQIAALVVTLMLSLVGGMLTGFLIKLPCFQYRGPVHEEVCRLVSSVACALSVRPSVACVVCCDDCTPTPLVVFHSG